MRLLRVYLDNCCYNRPFDDQNNIMVRLETEAKLFVQDLIISGKVELLWSFVLDYENNDNPFEERRSRIYEWKRMAVIDCNLSDEIMNNARDFMRIGLRQKDASHIACAILSKADYFLTTDQKILNKPITGVTVVNPIDFTRRFLDEK